MPAGTNLPYAFDKAGGVFVGGRCHLKEKLDLSDWKLAGCVVPESETAYRLGLLLGVIPGGIVSPSTLKMDYTTLETFHGGEFEGGLFLEHATRLTTIEGPIKVGGSLSLRLAESLKEMTGEVTVGGWADLTHCASLVRLPSPFVVGGKLYLTFCAALEVIPAGTRCQSLDISGTGLTLEGLLGVSVEQEFIAWDCPGLKKAPESEIRRVCGVSGKIWR